MTTRLYAEGCKQTAPSLGVAPQLCAAGIAQGVRKIILARIQIIDPQQLPRRDPRAQVNRSYSATQVALTILKHAPPQ